MKKLILFLLSASFLSYSFAQNYDLKLKELYKNLKRTSNPAIKTQIYIQLGTLYQQLDSIDKAIWAYENALNLMKNSRNINALYQINSFLGILYSEKADYNKAKQYFEKAVYYARRLNSEVELSNALVNYANVLRTLGQYKEAIKNYEEALTFVFKRNNLVMLKKIYANIALCYQQLGDQERYLKYYNLSVAIERQIKEQIIKQKEEEALRQAQLARQREMQLKLEQYKAKMIEDSLRYVQQLNEKNKIKIQLLEKEARLKEAELREKEAQLRAKQIMIISLIVILLIILIAGYFLIRAYRELKRLHAELEKKNRQIQESIQYASRIQRAILPSQAAIYSHFPKGAFILYLPRDVVSGDFYWFSDRGKYKFLALVDCTGHSVPGAFMSLIGNTLLNEIVNSKQIYDPKQILNELNKEVIELLHQRNPDQRVYDGMELVICRFEPEVDKMVCSSANQPVFIFKPNGDYQVIHGSIFSIGGYFGDRIKVEFENYEIDLEEDTVIYMSSDGYFDQFNENREKFTRKRFIEMLKEIYKLPLNQQFEIVLERLKKWQGNFRQIDDILVIGVKYSGKEMLKLDKNEK